jgi:hypothetical protein
LANFVLDGIYENGAVVLREKPNGITRARVKVTFLPEEPVDTSLNIATRLEAGERLLETMRKGIDFGGERFSREDMYEDRLKELDSRRAGH